MQKNSSPSAVLSLDSVHKSFGALTVARDISLDIVHGQAVGVIGPNGAGKTTLFNLITGDVRVSSGRVLYQGEDVTSRPARDRAKIGIARTYQVPHPFVGMTVFENTLVAAVFAGQMEMAEAEDQCSRMLRLTGLEPLADQLAGSLRLLERKRLELARALSSNPKMLLLDEIAGGLTDAECGELIQIISRIRDEGVTIVWIEHVVHALLNVVDSLLVLDRGAVIAMGEPEIVMNDPVVRATYFGHNDAGGIGE